MMSFLKKQNPNTVLGLTLDGSRLEAVLVRRTNGHVEVQKTVGATLSLDLFKNEPELVGREIRNHLDGAGIRERDCVVGVPLAWTLALHLKLPDLPEEDVESFLQIEAERGFPTGSENLQTGSSRHKLGSNQYVTIAAVPKTNVERLEQVLAAAQLTPVSFSPGITALQNPAQNTNEGVLALMIGENTVDLQITSGGGVAGLRALEAAYESEGGEKRLLCDFIARELRITMGQLPADLRDSIRSVKIYGPARLAQQLADEIRPVTGALGLRVDTVAKYSGSPFGVQLPADAAVSAALSLAVQQLAAKAPCYEFLPPKVSLWQQFNERYSSKKLVYAGAAAGVVLLVVACMFLYQQWHLTRLGSEWAGMEKKVHELEDIQAQIRKFRPWHDERLTGLTILKRVTESFPEDGAVTAKSMEIRNLSTVTCAGTARDQTTLLKTLDQLRGAREVTDVKVDLIRGGARTLQFTFNFHWGEGGTPQ